MPVTQDSPWKFSHRGGWIGSNVTYRCDVCGVTAQGNSMFHPEHPKNDCAWLKQQASNGVKK